MLYNRNEEAVFPKGGAPVDHTAKDTVLFGKYQIIRVIGRGRRGTVFLARHLGLDEARAIKRVGKENQEFPREAALLKALRHPGIPIIYDLEEDSFFFYLIEEYLEGESLYALIEREGSLARSRTISWGIDLCRILYYLHSFKPNPILYLDLQPGNILICRGALKLIDFDQAVSSSLAQELSKRYGTEGFAAPEQYTAEPLDERTDIYAIGILLCYMGLGRLPESAGGISKEERTVLGEELAAVIGRCLCRQREARYQTVPEVLEKLLELKAGAFTENEMPLLKIAVAGSSHGIGATHAALGLSSYLSGRGLSCLYRERNESGAVRQMASAKGLSPDEYGIYHGGQWALMPFYGQSVTLRLPSYDAVVEDFGTGLQPVLEGSFDLILLLCGGKSWEREKTAASIRFLAQKEGLCILFNHLSPGRRPILPGDIAGRGLACYRLPFFPDPEERELTEGLWEELVEKKLAKKKLVEKKLAKKKLVEKRLAEEKPMEKKLLKRGRWKGGFWKKS